MFDEIKRIAEDLIEKAKELEIELNSEMTLQELIEEIEAKKDEYLTIYEADYCYSVYNDELFEALAQYLSLLSYCQDIEDEMGESCIQNPMLINIAIFRWLINEYSDFTLRDLEVSL